MLLNIRFSSKAVFNIQNDVHYSNSTIYENGAVKRVMFDGGYATFSAMVMRAGRFRGRMWEGLVGQCQLFSLSLSHKHYPL